MSQETPDPAPAQPEIQAAGQQADEEVARVPFGKDPDAFDQSVAEILDADDPLHHVDARHPPRAGDDDGETGLAPGQAADDLEHGVVTMA